MPEISPRLAEFLIKTTMAKDIQEAFHTVFSEYLELKQNQLKENVFKFEEKWKMDFEQFRQKIKEDSLEKGIYSFEVEQDFWEWEEAATLKDHYDELRKEWM